MLLHLVQSHEEPDLSHNKEMPFNRRKETETLNWIMDNMLH